MPILRCGPMLFCHPQPPTQSLNTLTSVGWNMKMNSQVFATQMGNFLKENFLKNGNPGHGVLHHICKILAQSQNQSYMN